MDEREAELRLALVCYGGVSLAVYMHGVTKELHKLLRAARAFDERQPVNPFTEGTEKVYFDALTAIAKAGPRLMVSIDIIGGTSAGGINGIALSKAIACNASLEPLKKVWIDDGDIRKLLRGTRFLGLGVQVITTVVYQLARLLGSSSPLRGEYMSKLLLSALRDMDKSRPADAKPLLPKTFPGLELYVPTTDLDGFDVLVPSGVGGASNRDRDYRQVLVFSGQDDALTQFGAEYTADLAFAGRASASFPGAFAPVSQDSFANEVGKEDGEQLRLHPDTVFLRQYSREHTPKVFFVDGGVLDNAPFDLVIDAIARRRAQTRLYRQLIYIEPDPGQELYSRIVEKTTDEKRRWLIDLVAVSSVRGSHPILSDLTKLRDMNWRIAEIQAIAEQQENDVELRTKAVLRQMVPHGDQQSAQASTDDLSITQLVDVLTPEADGAASDDLLRSVSNNVYADAENSIGPAFPTYQRLKFETVLKRLADGINLYLVYPKPSAEAGLVTAAWIAWARQLDAWKAVDPDALGELLRATDMPYRERRLMFILARINELYDYVDADGWTPPVEQLNDLKFAIWTMIGNIRDAVIAAVSKIGGGQALDFLRLRDDDAVTFDPTKFAGEPENAKSFQRVFDRYATELEAVAQDSDALLGTFRRCTSGWKPEAADSLLNRYLGFALWDAILFPTFSLSELPQLTPIPVAQFSPLTAKALKAPVEENGELRRPRKDERPGKLKGVSVHHFGAFFAAESRENDYLWGRLDGVEQILRLLADVADRQAVEATLAPTTDDDAPPYLADALNAVLDSEKKLKRIKKLRKYLAAEVAKIGQNSTATGPEA